MSIESITAAASQSQGFPAPGSGRGDLSMEDFFKLLTTQLVSQDPLKPMEDVEFISQMTGFSTLQQMELVAGNMGQLLQEHRTVAAQSLIGKSVTAVTDSGDLIQGTVTRVEKTDGKMVPYIGEVPVSYESIIRISEPPVKTSYEDMDTP